MQRFLIMSIGNRSRGDDGVAPRLLERLVNGFPQQNMPTMKLIAEEVYQLQPEHIYDLQSADRVLLMDAARDLPEPFVLSRVSPSRSPTIGSHSLSPESLLGLYRELFQTEPPPCLLLSIQADDFGFTEALSPGATAAMHACEAFLRPRLIRPESFQLQDDC